MAKRRYKLRERESEEIVHTTFLDLSIELVTMVCDYLPIKDVLSLRTTCKDLSTKSTLTYASQKFKHVVAFLHPASLGQLLEIARNQGFALHIRTLTLTSDRLYPKASGPDLAKDTVASGKILVDMQASMENSSHDVSMLAEVLEKFTNLEYVKTFSYSVKYADEHRFPWLYHRYAAELGNYIICGREILRDQRLRGYLWNSPSILGNQGVGYRERLHTVLARAVERANTTVDLRLGIGQRSRQGHDAEHFDTELPAWKNSTAPLVRKLVLCYMQDGLFYRNLLLSVTNVEELTIDRGGGMRGTWPLVGPKHFIYRWSKLKHLQLNDQILPRVKDWLSFLDAHKDTIEQLTLNTVRIPRSTWKSTFDILLTFPKLGSVYFRQLEGEPIEPSTREDFDNIFVVEQRFGWGQINVLFSEDDDHDLIGRLLTVVLSDLRTYHRPYRRGSAADAHSIDFRKANAFKDGRIGM